MKQLSESAVELKAERDEAFHRYHQYEYGVGALEIGIVLASISLVTRIRAMTVGAAIIGALAIAWSLGTAANVF
jgi:hypothetical protein